MFQLEYSNRKPIYEQVKDKMKELIVNGVFGENEKLPSVREVATSIAINPNTIQKAYKELEAEGFIYSQRAKGYYVSPIKNNIKKIKGFEKIDEFEKIIKECFYLDVDYDILIAVIDKIYKEGNEND